MIVEWFFSLWGGVVDWISGLLGTADPPAFMTSIAGYLANIVSAANGLGAWIPWATVGVVGAALLTLWLVGVGVKGIRWLWGLTPFSGGS